MSLHVENVGKSEATDWEWAIVDEDGSVLDRFESESEATAALASYPQEL